MREITARTDLVYSTKISDETMEKIMEELSPDEIAKLFCLMTVELLCKKINKSDEEDTHSLLEIDPNSTSVYVDDTRVC